LIIQEYSGVVIGVIKKGTLNQINTSNLTLHSVVDGNVEFVEVNYWRNKGNIISVITLNSLISERVRFYC